jgi:nickel-type superoxide dismutase maturation protease
MKLPKSFGQLKKPKLILVRRVQGDSMLPAYRPRQIVIAILSPRQLKPGQVVIVSHDGIEKIKRVGQVQNGRVFVLGDNSPASTDSRSFGWLYEDQVIAKVVLCL